MCRAVDLGGDVGGGLAGAARSDPPVRAGTNSAANRAKRFVKRRGSGGRVPPRTVWVVAQRPSHDRPRPKRLGCFLVAHPMILIRESRHQARRQRHRPSSFPPEAMGAGDRCDCQRVRYHRSVHSRAQNNHGRGLLTWRGASRAGQIALTVAGAGAPIARLACGVPAKSGRWPGRPAHICRTRPTPRASM